MIEDKFGCAEFYNLKQPFRKTSRVSIPFIVFTLLFLTTFVLNCVFVVRHMDVVMNVAYIVSSLIPAFFVVISGCVDPGYLKKTPSSSEELFRIMSKYDPSLICFDCEVSRLPFRSSSLHAQSTASHAIRA